MTVPAISCPEDEGQRMPRAHLACVKTDVGVTDAASRYTNADIAARQRRWIERLQGQVSRSCQHQPGDGHAAEGGNARTEAGPPRLLNVCSNCSGNGPPGPAGGARARRCFLSIAGFPTTKSAWS